MNAPLIRLQNHCRGDLQASHGAVLEGIARHISREGCQFVMSGKAPAVGCRLRVPMDCGTSVSGTVRWVLGERIGFAFDRPIDPAAMAGLIQHFAGVRRFELLSIAED